MPGFSSSVPLLCMELEVALVLSVGIPPVPGQSCSVRFPAPDVGETTVPVIECEVPLLVVDALKPVEGSVHRQLPEHAEPLPASPVRVRSGLKVEHCTSPRPEKYQCRSEAEDYEAYDVKI